MEFYLDCILVMYIIFLKFFCFFFLKIITDENESNSNLNYKEDKFMGKANESTLQFH